MSMISGPALEWRGLVCCVAEGKDWVGGLVCCGAEGKDWVGGVASFTPLPVPFIHSRRRGQ